MKKNETDEALEEVLKWVKQKQEDERREAWVRTRCIAFGMMMAGVIHQIFSWAVDHYIQLKAAFIAFFKAGNGL